MLRKFAAALIALAPATAVTAQTVATAPAVDFNTARFAPGSWGSWGIPRVPN